MEAEPAPVGTSGSMTIDSLRAMVRAVVAELRSKGRVTSADLLQAAVDLESSNAEAVLVMREAMIRTRSDWAAPDVSSRHQAARALEAAKRFAIEL